MRRIWLAMIGVLASACTSAEEAGRQVKFACENGETMELKQQPAASGFLYSKGHFSVRGKGDELIVEVGKMVPLECKALP